MSEKGNGIVVIAAIVIAALVYYIFVLRPADREPTRPVDRGTVDNYLAETPALPGKQYMREGDPAPDFIYPDINSKIICLSDFIGRKYVVLCFWATWDSDCQNELPILQKFYYIHNRKVEIIAVTSEDTEMWETIKDTARAKQLGFTVIHDPSSIISNAYAHEDVPFLVFIDKEGKIVATESVFNPAVDVTIPRIFDLRR